MNRRRFIKGILIDPANQEIKEVEVPVSDDNTTLHGIYRHLDCSCVDVGRDGLRYLPSHPTDDVWFDDEGLFRRGEQYMFEVPGWVPLIGNGLILGYDQLGNCIDHTLTAEDLEALRATVIFYLKKES